MDTKELRKLDKAAIPAPWYAGSFRGVEIDGDYDTVEFCKHPEPDAIADRPDGLGNTTIVSSGGGEYAADAPSLKLAATARNALPYMLDVIEAAERLRSESADNNPCPDPILRHTYAKQLDTALAAFRNAK